MFHTNIIIGIAFVFLASCSSELGGVPIEDSPDSGKANPKEEKVVVCDEQVPIIFEHRILKPDILLVVDRSGSMLKRINTGNTKWDTLHVALNNLLESKAEFVNFGLMLFPFNGSCGKGEVLSEPGLDNTQSISLALNSAPPYTRQFTPTHQSLQEAKSFFNRTTVNPDGRLILLATDGFPSGNCGSSIDLSVKAVEELTQIDVKTYVLGFSSGADLSGLNAMAVAGNTKKMYDAVTPEDLTNALDKIIGDVTITSCDFKLKQTPQKDTDIIVKVGEKELKRDDPNGWKYDTGTKTITLLGTSCDSLEEGSESNIDVNLGCGAIIID